VNSQGRADDIKVTQSLDPGLDANAVAAVSQWLFKAGSKDGQPVDVAVAIEVNFRLL
jgi:TonB family protein